MIVTIVLKTNGLCNSSCYFSSLNTRMTSKQGKRLNPFQHALKRPDTYIGSAQTVSKETWIYKDPPNSGADEEDGDWAKSPEEEDAVQDDMVRVVQKLIRYNPGLISVIKEILSNAIDNKWRSEQHSITMKSITITIDNDPESEKFGWITIMNDGYCIPVEKAKYEYEDYRTGKTTEEWLYPAEVFFGEMLAGTNFDEDDTRKTSGKNGMGGKAAVVFSKEMIVDQSNPEQRKRFVQTYRNNGTERDEPIITSYKSKVGYTSISFLPDYEYFKYEEKMGDDLFNLLKRLIYECAMITKLNVTLNGEKVLVKDLTKYVRMFYPNVKENCMMHFVAPNGDECVLVEKGYADREETDDISHVSWVNGVNTLDGGVHVAAWRDAIIPAIVLQYNARKPPKGEKTPLKTTAKQLYPYFTLFVRCEVAGAKFDTQTKDRCNSPDPILLAVPKSKEEKAFKESIKASIPKILKWNFVLLSDEKLSMIADRTQSTKEKTGKKRLCFGSKADDANFADTDKAEDCVGIVNEGLSAKAFADRLVAAIENGTDYYGTFAIKGKFLNVQNSSKRKTNANKEVQSIKDFFGLTTGADYRDPATRKTLRYGKIWLMTDQDDDGFHIRGLLLNFFYTMWPSLFELKCKDGTPFIESFTTAVVMARKGTKTLKLIYSNPDAREWLKDPENTKGWTIKYYKGLGTHKPGDEETYLDDPKKIKYTLDGQEAEYMDLGFNDKQSNWRKTWITQDMTKPGEVALMEEAYAPITIDGELSLSGFVSEQLIIYHIMSLSRAIPNMYDGFKESQRKAFFGISQDPDAKKGTENLENLVGSVKKLTGYHHGAKSLEDTIKKMAMGFVGSNNIPLLKNAGEFGTRKVGGGDAAAGRYIETGLEEICKSIFSTLDEPLLEKKKEEGKIVEYKFYMPILPMILINGADGMASGFSTKIPCYNPEDIATWIELWLDSEDGTVEMNALKPWYRGFIGEIELLAKAGKDPVLYTGEEGQTAVAWRSKGILEKSTTNKGWWYIRELPIGMWTTAMKMHIEWLWNGTPPEGSKKKKGERYLKDVRWKGTVNTVRWEILPTKDFIPDMEVAGNFRCLQDVSHLTNMHMLDENDYPVKFASPEEFLASFCQTRLNYYEMRKNYWLDEHKRELVRESDRYKYVKAVVEQKLNMYQSDEDLEKDMLELGLRKSDGRFEYLLSMQMRSMTVKKMEEIKKDITRIKGLVNEFNSKTTREMWKVDLQKFREAYAKFLTTRSEELKFKKKRAVKKI